MRSTWGPSREATSWTAASIVELLVVAVIMSTRIVPPGATQGIGTVNWLGRVGVTLALLRMAWLICDFDTARFAVSAASARANAPGPVSGFGVV